jgi:hypothetical protein
MPLASSLALAALGLAADYAAGLRANLAQHEAERAASAALGYRMPLRTQHPPPRTSTHRIDPFALGLAAANPFGPACIHATTSPLLSAAECDALVSEAAAHIRGGGGSTFTLTATNRDAALHELPR